jgi:hypothetical protein
MYSYMMLCNEERFNSNNFDMSPVKTGNQKIQDLLFRLSRALLQIRIKVSK